MKDYMGNKYPKDIQFAAICKQELNKYRQPLGLSVQELSNKLGMSKSTYESKSKEEGTSEWTVSDLDHIIDLTGSTRALEFLCFKHGLETKKINIEKVCKATHEIGNQADTAMIEFNEAWKKTKEIIKEEILSKKQAVQATKEIDEAIKELQQLKHDIECKSNEDT